MRRQRRSQRRRPRSNPSTETTVFIVAGVAAGAGILLWLFARRRGTQQAAQLQASVGAASQYPDSQPAQPGTSSTAQQSQPQTTQTLQESVSSGLGGGDRLSTIVARLRGSSSALQLYAFQALMYEVRLTDAIPDGLQGPVTTAMIQDLQRRDSLPQTGTFDPSLVAAAVDVTGYSAGASLRPIPDQLPDDLVAQMNAFIASQVPDNAPVVFSRG